MKSWAPTPPLPIEGGAEAAGERFATRTVAVPESVLDRVRDGGGRVGLGIAELADAGRDWWPLAIGWAAAGKVPTRPAALARPVTASQVADLLRSCSDDLVPVSPVAGRSGVCGCSLPLFGGVALDTTGLCGDVEVDEASLVAQAGAGMNGRALEEALRATGPGYTLGHWPQSMDLSTVGGWIACRSAGQYSTRYGKIEDMVAGLEVALADGRVVRTGAQAPRAATGPDLTQLFTGSEGVLGVITRAWLRVRPKPAAEARRAFSFGGCGAGPRRRSCASTTSPNRSGPSTSSVAAPSSCSTRRTPSSLRPRWRSSTTSARPPSGSTTGSSMRGSKRETTSRSSCRSGDRVSWWTRPKWRDPGGSSTGSPRRYRARCAPSTEPSAPRCTCRTRIPTARACTSRSPGRGRAAGTRTGRGRRATTPGPGTP